MSAFGDYKAYKQYEPAYEGWHDRREYIDAKRMEFLRQNPNKINKDDIQRGKTLIHAIDVMDEYSQKRSEDMEVATETAVGYGLDAAMFGGAALGGVIGNLKPVRGAIKKYFSNSKYAKQITTFLPLGVGAITGVIAAFPLYAWAAKAEVAASRRGRFEAMRKDLKDPKVFAILNDEQINTAKENAKNIQLPSDKKSYFDLGEGFKTLKEMALDSKEYKAQKKQFDMELLEAEKHFNDKMTPEETLRAKKEQQLLTKLVEKIDIASQDYAENAELATQTIVIGTLALGTLFNMVLGKVLKACKIKAEGKIMAISQIASVVIPVVLSLVSAQIQKQASRVSINRAVNPVFTAKKTSSKTEDILTLF